MSQPTNKHKNFHIPQELFLWKQDSMIQNYDQEDDFMEVQRGQEAFSELYHEYKDIISPPEEQKKQNYFQISDNENSSLHFDVNFTSEPYINTSVGIPSPMEKQKQIPEKIPKKKFIDKSYCRYILLYVFRTIENKQYAEIITNICSLYQINYNNFVEYYRKQRILIMGYQSLKKELIYDNDSIPDQNRKKVFKEVLVWYLDQLATKHILLSKKQNFEEYLKFKNYVMSYYIHNPKSWAGNKPLWN